MFCKNNTYFNLAWVYLSTLFLDNAALVKNSSLCSQYTTRCIFFSSGFVNKMSQKEWHAKFDKIAYIISYKFFSKREGFLVTTEIVALNTCINKNGQQLYCKQHGKTLCILTHINIIC